MKNNFLMLSLLSACGILSAQGYTGINNESPKAALDVKTAQTGHEVMRVSTIPISVVEKDKPFILLAGEAEDNGYNVRHITAADFFNMIKTEIPSLRRISLTNNTRYTFPVFDKTTQIDSNRELPLKTLIYNTDTTLFRFDATEGSVEILETGYYDISSWVGIDQLNNFEGEVIISLGKKKRNGSSYQNFKRSIITRTRNGIVYNTAKEGTGASFSFVDKFEAGDKIVTRVNAGYISNIAVSTGNASLTVSRVDKANTATTLTP